MKQFLRLSLCGSVAAILTVVFLVLLTRLGNAQMRNSLDLLVWLQKWSDAERRQEELKARGAPVFHRTTEKNRIVVELIARRLTLREAAQQFRELDEEVSQVQPEVPRAPASDGDEAACRNVITWVRSQLSANPKEADWVVMQLEREMRDGGGAQH
jgi:hypothetical protein